MRTLTLILFLILSIGAQAQSDSTDYYLNASGEHMVKYTRQMNSALIVAILGTVVSMANSSAGNNAFIESEALTIATLFGSSILYISAIQQLKTSGLYLQKKKKPTKNPKKSIFYSVPKKKD